MGIFAHPDDESLLIGGTFALAHEEGWQTTLVTVTRGELGGRFSGIYGKKLATVRSRELKDAARLLHIDSLHAWDFSDKGVSQAKKAVTARLIELISKYKPRILITHDRSDPSQHPDHIATAQAVIDAVRKMRRQWKQGVLFAMLRPSPGHLTYAIDIATYRETKIRACRAHASQGLFRQMRLPVDLYYALNHFEYFKRYEKEPTMDDKRHHPNKK